MGHGSSHIHQSNDDKFLIISNPAEKVEFDTSQSRMVCFAINDQSHEKFKAKRLGRSVVNDAKLIRETFVRIGAIPTDNATVHIATENPSDCTFEGIRARFIDAAKLVSESGMFVFHFSGHGVRVGDDQWGLAPLDFDYNVRTYVTASVLSDWLNEAGCKAKHVLFTLDCCYAGGIGDALSTAILNRSLFIVSACTANEISYVLDTLGHSVFSYFLADAAMRKTADPQKLPLHDILTECRTCCVALSSLMVKYEEPGKISSCQTQPEIAFNGSEGNADDETDGGPEFGRWLYVTKHYDFDSPVLPLHGETKKWLNSVVEFISVLYDRGLLKGKILNTAVCSIVLSIASIQLAFQPDTVAHPNTFIRAFLETAAFFDLHCPGVAITIAHFEIGWGFYDFILQKNNVDGAKIRALRNVILKENDVPVAEDECDSGQNERTSPFKMEIWVPL